MTQINPFSGYLGQGTQVQKRQATEKEEQARRAQNVAKNVTLRGDQLEHQIESSEAVTPVHEQQKEHDDARKKQHHPKKSKDDESTDDGESRLDLTA